MIIIVWVAFLLIVIGAIGYVYWRLARSGGQPELAESLDIGRVIGRSFAPLSTRGLPLIGLALLLILLPRLAGYGVTRAIGLPPGENMMPAIGPGYFVLMAVLWLCGILFSVVAIPICVAWFRDQEPDYPAALRSAIGLLLPAIGVRILVMLGVWIGMLLLVVPGVMLALRWGVTIPVLLTEGTGISGSFARSSELTAGSRWRLLVVYGLLMVFILVGSAPSLLLKFLAPGSEAMAVPAMIAELIVTVLAGLVGTSLAAATYVELCDIREGGTASGLAEIFA
jgi:hypothetical protein